MSLNKFIDRQRSKLTREKARHKGGNSLHGSYLRGFFSDDDLLEPAKDDMQKAKQQQQIKDVKSQLSRRGIAPFSDDDIAYGLRTAFTNGSIGKTTTLLSLIQDSENMVVRKYDESVNFSGAVNRSGISCYLDTVLFAMFAQLKSFEVMLNSQLEDRDRNHLAALLRLWVNIERSGYLVTTDITREIQEALRMCGWKDAGEKRQQDALEAFTFILEQLGFPDLHLKMDIFHSGKEEKIDDHKIVRERVLVMPLPEPRKDGNPIKLEDCFELALIARVDVKRKYEQRRATFSSLRSPQSTDFNKAATVHVEAVEVSEPNTPASNLPTGVTSPQDPSRPLPGPKTPSFIQEREVSDDEKALEAGDTTKPRKKLRGRAASSRKEVLMPAWQMYSLIPFHTEEAPKSDAEVVQHLREKEPVLCIALKRYTFGTDGHASRRDDYVDIPLDMALPHFIQSNGSQESNRLFEKFKISLQSLVCHRGNHVESGHYVSIVRVSASGGGSKWLLFDDLADKRVEEIDIQQKLKDEMPYLLFYRVEPIDERVPTLRTQPSTTSDTSEAAVVGSAPSIGSESDATAPDRPSLESSSHARGRTSTSRERPSSTVRTDPSRLSRLSAEGFQPRPGPGPTANSTPAPASTGSATKASLAPSASLTPSAAAANKSAPPSRRTSLLTRRPRRHSRGTSAEPTLPVDTTPSRTSTSRNRLSGLFSSTVPAARVPSNPSNIIITGEPTKELSKLKDASRSKEPPKPKGPSNPKPELASAAATKPSRLEKRDRDKEKGKDKDNDKSREKERFRPGPSSHGTLSKAKRGERPERECSVM